jgi:ATP-dependent RNA helicase SUPV3L1/SUV3
MLRPVRICAGHGVCEEKGLKSNKRAALDGVFTAKRFSFTMALAKSHQTHDFQSMAKDGTARVTAVLGPTNTGKTHLAVERFCAHSSGIMGFPLRLLAREVYDRVVAIKGPNEVALITGEEKVVPPGARWFLTTVESMPQDRDVAFVALDEAQLGADLERGHVFTDRLLNMRGREETMILGSESLKPLVRKLVPHAEIITRPRFSSLEYAGSKKLTRLPPRSAIIGFSVDEIYAAAELIRRTQGGAAVVMGALSPRTRNAQVAMYQSGDVDFLVATDAIGMGLNMDVGHVAFANLSKFDGRRRRRLTVAEMAQIAGRAGRHHRNGTFGTVSGLNDDVEFTPDEIERIEDHRFRPLEQLMWRNSDLDFNCPADLLASLQHLPGQPGLRLTPDALDQQVLAILASDPTISAQRWSAAQTARLWEVCRLPDFLKRGPEFHAGFLMRIWSHLGGNGRIPSNWIAGELTRLDSVQGDIDTLSTRIAAARTWAFIANQANWLDDPSHWAGRCMELEEKLSEALHRKLTERFVDRRTSLLRRAKAEFAEHLPVSVSDEGIVQVDGEDIGRLKGFTFQPDPSARHAERKALLSAAERQLTRELATRANRLSSAPDLDFSLHIDAGAPVEILWLGEPVVTLSRGKSALSPNIVPSSAINRLPQPLRDMIISRLTIWLRTHVDSRLGRLRWVERTTQSPERPLVVRAILAALSEGLGLCERAHVATALPSLTPQDRNWLRQAGVTIGPLDIVIDALLKPQPAALRIALLCVARGRVMLPVPMAGLGLLDKPTPELVEGARMAGYRSFGDQMLRIDLLNRLSVELHRQRAGNAPFQPDATLSNRLGIGKATLDRVLRALGFRPMSSVGSNHWKWHGLQHKRPDPRPDNPVFDALRQIVRL